MCVACGSELPTCLTLIRSSVVSRAAKLLGYRLYRDRSRTSCRPREMGWLVLGLRPAGARGGRSDSKEVWKQSPKSECPSHTPQAEVQPKRRCASMKVLIGVDPHKTSVALAAVDEAKGELLERASFAQDRAGLSALERWAKRFPERRPKRWRTPGREATLGSGVPGHPAVEPRKRACSRSGRKRERERQGGVP